MENPIKMDAFGGTHYFRKHPNSYILKGNSGGDNCIRRGGVDPMNASVFSFLKKKTKGPKERNLSREKKLLLSIESWLFNRDPCKGFIKIPI